MVLEAAPTVAAGRFGFATGLRCRICGTPTALEPAYFCSECFGPLEVAFDYAAIAATIRRNDIENGPPSIWRYAPFLPAPATGRVDLGAGFTPLRPAPRLAAELGLRKLWLKLDLYNPTYSFKDRVVSVALSAARAFGFTVAGCASTGNLANSVAAHATSHGMRSVVLIPADLEAGKVAASTVYGGDVIGVDGSYDDVNRLCAELLATRRWAFVNVNLRPFYAEGSKTLGFEICEQLGWRVPDAVVCPVASGAMLTKVAKGIRELQKTGFVDPGPVSVYGAQAEGCSPVATAFAQGAEDVRPVRPKTLAKSLAIGDPGDGIFALREVRDSGGAVAAVPESRVAEGIRLLARTEGIFGESAAGVTISALADLVGSGCIDSDAETVALITGSGLKTLEVLGAAHPTHTIAPRLAEIDRVFPEEA